MSAKASAWRCFAKFVHRRKPTARPANAKAAQGKRGKSQGCGSLKMWTPLTYDSRGQGRNFGRCVVQKGGVSIATRVAAARLAAMVRLRAKTRDSADVK